MPVSNKAFQFTNRNRFTFESSDTFTLTLAFLRAYTPADRRQGTGLGDDLIGSFKIALSDLWEGNRDA